MPFFKSVIIYSVIGSYGFFNSQVLSTILKCLPIFCLMAFIFFMGFKNTKEFGYHKTILIGLAFSSVGDAFLDYKDGELFPLGMLAFGVAQVCYIWAFKFKPMNVTSFVIGFLSYGFGIFGKYFINIFTISTDFFFQFQQFH